jgi:ligand-binding sensor domain-containing protein/serine phosphatase RsbU (regulator of sigma subunit)
LWKTQNKRYFYNSPSPTKNIPLSIGFTDNYINKIYEDVNQNIWVTTNGGGAYRYDKKQNRFFRISEISINTTGVILEDNRKTLWVSATNNLFYLDTNTQKFQSYPQFTNAIITEVLEIRNGIFLVATDGAGLFVIDIAQKTQKQYSHEEKNANSLSNNSIHSIYKDMNGDVWVGTRNGLDRLSLTTMNFEHFPIQEDKSKSLLINVVRVINGRGHEVWFGTENGGLSRLDLKTMRFTHHILDKANPNSISDNSIWAIYFDRQNRLWVGTFSGGANIADPYVEKFTKPTIELKNQTVNAILKDSKNRLWIGTEGGIAVKEGEKVTHYIHDPKQANSLPNNPVLAIYEDLDKRIWVGTWDGGLSRFDEEKKHFINIKADINSPKKLSDPNIFDVLQSSENKQLFLASFGGLLVMESENPPLFSTYATDTQNPKSIVSNYVTTVFEDSKKNIWIGTTNGLNRFDIKTKSFVLYAHNPEDSTSISANDVKNIIEDSKGRIWIGTREGLNLILKDGIFKSYTKADGLPNNTINGIVEDQKGNLWLSTNEGLSVFNPEKNTFRNFTDSDGLQSKQFKPDSYFADKEGIIYFGGVNGFNAFHPDSVKDNPHLPSVLLTDLKIFNKSVKVGEYDSLLKSVIQQTQEITLNHTHSVFSIEYVGINFTHSNKNQYAYRLEPFEDEWNYVGSKREATYTNLDAGTYTFQVKASNNDGIWNEEGATLKITILPPWWKTWWFRGGLLLLIGIAIIAYNRIKMATLKKRNLVLEQKVADRTKDLKLASEQIKLKNEELQASEEELRQNMEELETNQELLKSQKDQLELAFQELHKQNTKVNDSIRYAERIQQAILPHEEVLKAAFQEHFVIYKPKDVVSGDFYWYFETTSITNEQLSMTNEQLPMTNEQLPINTEKQNKEQPNYSTIQLSNYSKKKFLAVVDCTGHGVPGAFMSMIGNAVLREIVESKKVYEPAEILNELNKSIITSLNKKDKSFQDGMDIVLCCFENTPSGQVKLTYAGAKRPLYYFDTELREIKADSTSIGHKADIQYTQSEQILQPNTTLFLTTDGWIDIINYERQRFGSGKLKEMLKTGAFLSLETQKRMFQNELLTYQQNSEQRDDILMVGVRV